MKRISEYFSTMFISDYCLVILLNCVLCHPHLVTHQTALRNVGEGNGIQSKRQINSIETESSFETNGVSRGTYGGFYINYTITDNDIGPAEAFVHGRYEVPKADYYQQYRHNEPDTSSLGYYVSYGKQYLVKGNALFKVYTITHYYSHQNPSKPSRYVSERQTEYVSSRLIDECNINAFYICPENTEPLCIHNGTIVCGTIMNYTRSCEIGAYQEMTCVETRIPCTDSTKVCINNLERISMPCLAKIIVDHPWEENVVSVAGTFVILPNTPESERSYCVVIIADPVIIDEELEFDEEPEVIVTPRSYF